MADADSSMSATAADAAAAATKLFMVLWRWEELVHWGWQVAE